MPSSTSIPNLAVKRRYRSAGNASPALTPRRTLPNVLSGRPAASIAAYAVGAPKNSVGLVLSSTLASRAGVARARSRTARAPTENGNVSVLPRP
jgi:hypothetical protein